MAGYRGWSKSNNAYNAEGEGRLTATALARRLRCRSSAITALLTPIEWHHTSSWYNETNYYDEPLLLALAAGDRRAAIEAADDGADGAVGDPRPRWMLVRETLRERQELLQRLRNHRKGRGERRWTGCKVMWLDWNGSRRRRQCEEREVDACTVVWKGGATVVVEPPSGGSFRKMIGTRGFTVDSADGSPIICEWDTPATLDRR